jgi:hypothetical protein
MIEAVEIPEGTRGRWTVKRFTVSETEAKATQLRAMMKGERYGMVWHDIWDSFCGDNLPEMTRLKRKYGRRADWQGCWGEWQCRRHR